MKRTLFALLAGVLMVSGTTVAYADHAWGNYHWARTVNPFTLAVVDSVVAPWDSYLDTTIADWSASSVLHLVKESGSTNSVDRRHCKPIAGKIRACNYAYGKTGWLGIASVYASGNHITQSTTKLNDTYFNTAAYNTPAWRNLVLCQEVGHGFGLDHQDEAFTNTNLGTCMDYTNNPGTNQHPNQHDYDMLESIYTHLDAVSTIAAVTVQAPPDTVTEDPRTWGREKGRMDEGRSSVFQRTLSDGTEVITHVYWVEEARERASRSR